MHLAAITRKGDRPIGGVRFHAAAAIGNRDRPVGGSQGDAAMNAAYLDRPVLGFEIQRGVARRMHDKHRQPLRRVGGWPAIRDSPRGVPHRDAARHLFRRAARLRRCDLAGLHRVIGPVPPAHPNLPAFGRVQFQDRRLAFAQRKALVNLRGFTGRAHFQIRATLGIAVDVKVKAPIFGRMRLAGSHQPPQTKHRRRNIEEAFVLHIQFRRAPGSAVSKGISQRVARRAFWAAWGLPFAPRSVPGVSGPDFTWTVTRSWSFSPPAPTAEIVYVVDFLGWSVAHPFPALPPRNPMGSMVTARAFSTE